METRDQDVKPCTREHFLQVSQRRRWGTLQASVERCRRQGSFTPAFSHQATAPTERPRVRRRLRQVTDGRGWPVLATIVRADPDGRPERVFLQEELFGPEGSRQVVASYDRMARHHLCQAQTYRERALARFGVQRPLCDKDGDEDDGAAAT